MMLTLTWVQSQIEIDRLNNLIDVAGMITVATVAKRYRPSKQDYCAMRADFIPKAQIQSHSEIKRTL